MHRQVNGAHCIVPLRFAGFQVPTEPKVEGQLAGDLDVVLRVQSKVPVRRSRQDLVTDSAIAGTQQKRSVTDAPEIGGDARVGPLGHVARKTELAGRRAEVRLAQLGVVHVVEPDVRSELETVAARNPHQVSHQHVGISAQPVIIASIGSELGHVLNGDGRKNVPVGNGVN